MVQRVSGKLEVLHNLAKLADSVIVGGGMANTFLLAAGHEIGNSLAEPDLIAEARQLLDLTGDSVASGRHGYQPARLRRRIHSATG